MSQPSTIVPSIKTAGTTADLSLTETLQVLELARSLQQERTLGEQALARSTLRESLKKRLRDAAAITGDTVSEADIDSAIQQYFDRLHDYADPPLSFSVVLAHLYIRRFTLGIIAMMVLLGIVVTVIL